MIDVTLRLEGRSLHLVRRAGDGDFCQNHAAHRPIVPEPFVRAEIAHAARGSASALAELRALVQAEGLLSGSGRLTDSDVLQQVAWLLETGRLLLLECVHVWRELPDAPRAPLPRGASRPRPVDTETEKTWIAIEVLDDRGKPVAGERYRVKVPGGTYEEGNLDEKGRAKITNIDSGMCDVSFLDVDGREWKPA